MLNTLRQTVKGGLILNDWLGDGGNPVAVDHAERRSAVCEHCPENVKGNWLDRLKKIVSDRIKEHIAFKNEIGLKVSNEDKIGFCKQCGCPLQLKVWCPITHIMRHTKPNEVLDYPAPCWIRKELTGI